MNWVAITGFFVAVVPLVLTPGASFTLAMQRSLAGQRRATWWVVAGTATGIYTHALLAAAGLSALVMHSSEAFMVVKIIGGVYLVGLGVVTIWRTRQRAVALVPRQLPWAGHHTYPQAVLANVLNPKAASVYLTLAPQFLHVEQVDVGPLLVLASVHVLTMAAWLVLCSLVLTRGSRAIASRRFSAAMSRLGGAILVALGVRTVVS